MVKIKVWCDTCEDLKEAKEITVDSEHAHFYLKCNHEVTIALQTGLRLKV